MIYSNYIIASSKLDDTVSGYAGDQTCIAFGLLNYFFNALITYLGSIEYLSLYTA
jgi:hypothetical protein